MLDSSFLPQDKVSEFAAMTPQQILRETQRAAGDEKLTMWHDTLIESGRELRVVQDVMPIFPHSSPDADPVSENERRTRARTTVTRKKRRNRA